MAAKRSRFAGPTRKPRRPGIILRSPRRLVSRHRAQARSSAPRRRSRVILFTGKKALISQYLGMPYIDYTEIGEGCAVVAAELASTASMTVWMSRRVRLRRHFNRADRMLSASVGR